MVEELYNLPPKFTDLYEDEEAFVPGDDSYAKRKS